MKTRSARGDTIGVLLVQEKYSTIPKRSKQCLRNKRTVMGLACLKSDEDVRKL
jgi:hypothetical protein